MRESSPRVPPAHLFSPTANRLDLNPIYHKDPKSLDEYIRKQRKEMGLLERELAEKLGVSVTTIKRWELENGRPAPENMEKLGRLFFLPDINPPLPNSQTCPRIPREGAG